MPDSRRCRRQIAWAAVAAFALRAAFAFGYWVDRPMTHDEHEYLALAAALASGHGLTYLEPPKGTTAQFGRAPGYPAFLAAIGAGTTDAGSAPDRVKLVQAILGSFAVVLIAIAAYRAGGPLAGVVAAWLAAIYPPLVWMPAYVLSETLYSVLALGTALALQAAADAPRRAAHAAGAGVLCGAAVLVRPAMLFFLPLAAGWLVWRRTPRLAAALAFGALLVIAPWTARNYLVHGRFVLVASEGGVTFWTGNHPLARGEGDLAANPALKEEELRFRRAHPGLTSEQLEPLYYRDAFRHIAADPLRWLGLLGRKVFYTLVPAGPSYALHSRRYRTASVASYLIVLPFAIAGATLLWRNPRRPAALLLLAAASVLVGIVFFPQERFRIPVIDPVLIVCAATFVAFHASRRDRGRGGRAARAFTSP